MNGLVFAIAAMLAIYLFYREFNEPRGFCPMCGGQKQHHSSCPQKDRDE